MRIFVGIDIPKEVKIALNDETDKFLKYTSHSKKTLVDNFHLTLKFIGEIDISQIETLEHILKEQLKDVDSFDIQLKDFGSFKKKDGYILWMGVLKGVGMLKTIHKKIDDVLNKQYGLDKAIFSPHVTLAKRVELKDQNELRKNKTRAYNFKVEHIVIYYSHIVDDVLTYTPLSRIALN